MWILILAYFWQSSPTDIDNVWAEASGLQGSKKGSRPIRQLGFLHWEASMGHDGDGDVSNDRDVKNVQTIDAFT